MGVMCLTYTLLSNISLCIGQEAAASETEQRSHRQATLQLLEASIASVPEPRQVPCKGKEEASEHEPAACSYLTATDFTECHGRQATLKRIQLLEASVAAAVGISMVYSSSALRAKPEYYRCCPHVLSLHAFAALYESS